MLKLLLLLLLLSNCSGLSNLKLKVHGQLVATTSLGLFQQKKKSVDSKKVDPILVTPSYDLAIGSVAVGGVSFISAALAGDGSGISFGQGFGTFMVIFGAFVARQATKLRFKFDDNKFSLVKADSGSTRENIVVGGENSWRYDSFINWGFVPSESFPILVYFKETQTPQEKWAKAPIFVDDLEGQAHFFPAIANVQELKKLFVKNSCKRLIK